MTTPATPPTLRELVERWWSWYDQSQDDFDDPPPADLVASSFAALNTPAPAAPDFAALRQAAEAALAEAPGRWESIEVDPDGEDDSWIVVFGRAPNGVPVSDSSLMYQSLTDYIAAANPAAVLSLLTALDTARAENARLQEFADRIKHDAGENLRARNRAEAEAERQRAGYASLSRLIEPHHKGATGRDMTVEEIAQFIVDCCKRIDDWGDEAERLRSRAANAEIAAVMADERHKQLEHRENICAQHLRGALDRESNLAAEVERLAELVHVEHDEAADWWRKYNELELTHNMHVERVGFELSELKQQLAASTELLALREAQLFDELNRDDDALRQRSAALEGVTGAGKESER